MSREIQVTGSAAVWSIEGSTQPLWPYDMDDSYLQLDLGASELEGLPTDVRIFKKPWFKQNYRHTSPRNLRFYKRPFFEVETPE